MNMDMDMLAAPKKIVDGLTEVFQGFAQMFEGVSEQLELLAAGTAEAEEDKLLPVGSELPPDKPLPADVSAKGVTLPRPRKKPVKRHKAPDAGPVSDSVSDSESVEEAAPAPTERAAQDEAAAVEEAAEENTEETLPWKEDTGQKEQPPGKVPDADKPTEAPPGQNPKPPIITKDDVTSVNVAKIKQKRSNNEKIGQLLKAYGVSALSDLPAEKYEAFLTDISQL